jgi:hypothetical protein
MKKNKKVWFFGDSFTANYNHFSNYNWATPYLKHMGYTPTHWTEMVGKNLGLKIENRGEGGSDNYTILDAIIAEMEVIGPDDYIIIGWSEHTRFRIVDPRENMENRFAPIHASETEAYGDISNDVLMQIILNRDSPLFVGEVVGWMNLLRKLFKTNHIIHWSFFYSFNRVNILNTWMLERFQKEGGRIMDETNGKVNDGHPGEKGCRIISELICQYIQSGVYKDLIIEHNIPHNMQLPLAWQRRPKDK